MIKNLKNTIISYAISLVLFILMIICMCVFCDPTFAIIDKTQQLIVFLLFINSIIFYIIAIVFNILLIIDLIKLKKEK